MNVLERLGQLFDEGYVGFIEIGLTDNGGVGVWFDRRGDEEAKSDGSGDTVEEAVQMAVAALERSVAPMRHDALAEEADRD